VAPSETPLRGVLHPQHHYACEGDELPLLRDLDLLVKNTNSGKNCILLIANCQLHIA